MKTTRLMLACLLALVAGVAWFGWQALERRDQDTAYKQLVAARALIEEDPNARVLAVLMLDRGLGFNPPLALTQELLMERAELRAKSGAYELAIEDWSRLLKTKPNDIEIMLEIAALEARSGNPEGASEVYGRVLKFQPDNGWVRSLMAREAAKRLSEYKDEIFDALKEYATREDLEWFDAAFDRLAHLPSSDPVRAGLLLDLEQHLSEAALDVAIPAIDQMQAKLALSRREFATSIAGSVNANNIFPIMDSLFKAGRLADAVDYGLAATRFRTGANDPGTNHALALALEAMQRPVAAATVVRRAPKDNASWYADFLMGWCHILFEAKSWKELSQASHLVATRAGSQPSKRQQRADALFYNGFALARLGDDQGTIDKFRSFLGTRLEGPIPHALGIAWQFTAEARAAQGNSNGASTAYAALCEADPTFSGDAWLICADAAREHADGDERATKEATALAHTIALKPSTAEELLPRFLDAGERGLAWRGLTIAEISSNLRRSGRWHADAPTEPFVLYSLAVRYAKAGKHAGAALVWERLLQDLPGFIPAWDGLAKAQVAMDDLPACADSLLSILEIGGPSPTVLAAMKDLSAELESNPKRPQLSSSLVQRWMLFNPSFTGSLELIREQRDTGQPEAAIKTLAHMSRAGFQDGDRVLLGGILVELERYGLALTMLKQIADDSTLAAHAAILRAIASSAAGSDERLTAALDTLVQAPIEQLGGIPSELLERCFRELHAGNNGASLLRYTQHFVNLPTLCTGARMNQAALAELLYGSPEMASEWVEMADALSTDSSPIVGRLILADAKQDQTAKLAALRDLRSEAPVWLTSVDLVLLVALENRRGEARALIDSELALAPTDMRLWLTSALLDALDKKPLSPVKGLSVAALLGPAAQAPLDRVAQVKPETARSLLTILLALDAPVWKHWAMGRMASTGLSNQLGPFAAALSTPTLDEIGSVDAVRDHLQKASAKWPGFAPFWDANEDLLLAIYGRRDHPNLVRRRSVRRQKGAPPRGGKPASSAELALDASFKATSEGDHKEAFAQAKLTGSDASIRAEAMLNLAACAAELQPKLAQKTYLDFLNDPDLSPTADADQAVNLLVIGKLLNIQLAIKPGVLAELAERFPHAPGLQLALAKLNIQERNLNSALERLDRFVASHDALEDIESGSSRAWFDLINKFDPNRALAFAEQQLELNPRQLASWIQRAEALNAVGRGSDALQLVRQLSRMSPSAEVARLRAGFVADAGGRHEEVLSALLLAGRGADAQDQAGLYDFINARSLANLQDDYLNQAIEKFDALLESPKTPGVPRRTITTRLAITLLQRGQAGDGKRALPLLVQAQDTARDALERDRLIALTNLARNLAGELRKQAEQ